MAQADPVEQWKGFSPEQRTQALGRMSPQQKLTLKGMLEKGATPSYSVPAADAPALRKTLMQKQADTDKKASALPPQAEAVASAQPSQGVVARGWDAANTPLGPKLPSFNKETEKLNQVQDFAQTERGRQGYAAHPLWTATKGFAAGMERDSANLLTPAFLATSVLPAASSLFEAAAPEVAMLSRVASKVSKVGTTAVFGATGAKQVLAAATNTEAPIEDRAQELFGGLSAMTGTAAEAGGVVRTARTPGNLRRMAQDALGAGEDFQEQIAKKYSKDATQVREDNQGIDQKNQQIAAANETAAKDVKRANDTAMLEHQQTTQQHGNEDVQTVAKHKEKVAVVKKEHEDALKAVREKNQQADEKHEEKTARIVLQERPGAEQTAALHEQAEGDVQEKGRAYLAKEAAVDAKVKAAADEVWRPFHDAAKAEVGVDQLATDLEKISARNPDAVRELRAITPDAADAAPDSLYAQDRAAIMRSQGYHGDYWDLPAERRAQIDKIASSSGFEPEPVDFNPEVGKKMSLEEIHRAASVIGERVARGNYDGTLLGEMKQLHKALVRARMRGAMELGVAPQLEAGIKATREYKEAFGPKRKTKQTVRLDREQKVAPEVLKEQAEKARLDAAAKHDPSIVEDYKALQDARARVKQFKDADSLRKGLPQPDDRPEHKPEPKEPKGPEEPKLHGAPTTLGPNLKEPHVPTPEVPHKPDVPVPDVSVEMNEKLRRGLRTYGRWGSWVLRLVVGGATQHLLHGEGLGALASNLAMGQVALTALTDSLHENEGVLRWMGKPTVDSVRMLERIPPQDAANLRKAWTGLAVEDAKAGRGGGRIAPEVARFLGPTNLQLITAAVAASRPQTAAEAKQRVRAMHP